MSWLDRLKPKNRITQQQTCDTRPIAMIPVKRGGIYVTHDKALHLSTCFACVRAISEDIAKLPWQAFTKVGSSRERMSGDLEYLLNVRPNVSMGAFSFRETLLAHALTYGNGYAEIEYSVFNKVLALWPLMPDRVTPKWKPDGTVCYEVRQDSGDVVILEDNQVFHLHGMGFDGLTGYSMIGLAAQSLGFGLAAEEYGASYFGNNTTPGMALKTDAKLSDDGFKRLETQISERKGSGRAFEGLILEEGLDFARPNVSMVDAQYSETRQKIVEEICRWWRVPPHKVMELSRAHFANVENLDIDYTKSTIHPWTKRLEEEADHKLIGRRSRVGYTKINLNGLMRGDSTTRAQYYKDMLSNGVLSINKVLELEDMDPIGPEGDKRYIQLNMTTLEAVAEGRNLAAPAESPPGTPEVDDLLHSAFMKSLYFVQRNKGKNPDNFAAEIESHLIKVEPGINRILHGNHAKTSAYLRAAAIQFTNVYKGRAADFGEVANAVEAVE